MFNWHIVINLGLGLHECCQSSMLTGLHVFHVWCELRAGFEINHNLSKHTVSFLFTSEIFKIYFQFSLCEVLWNLGECEKWFVVERWKIRIINLNGTIINIEAMHF